MSHADLGDKLEARGRLSIDIPRLVETRALIQSNSGGGKSYLIRKLCEETEGKVQKCIFDIEGEFSSLREKGDYILAGKGGDVAADLRTAEMLIRKMREHRFSLIVDLSELKYPDRIRYVRIASETLIDAPKEFWHPILVVYDEGHHYAPEKGQSEAMAAVVDVNTRGRKRQIASIMATQRLSKLHKDIAAECLNKFIGRTGLDIDMKRAAEELGFTAKEQMLGLRKLHPGEFYSFGPAISDEVTKFKVGQVSTTHGHLTRKTYKVPAPTSAIKKLLPTLEDLPKAAEEEVRDREALMKKVRELERQLRTQAKPPMDEVEIQKAANRMVTALKKNLLKHTSPLFGRIDEALESLRKAEPLMQEMFDAIKIAEAELPMPTDRAVTVSIHPTFPPEVLRHVASSVRSAAVVRDGRTFGQCERKILGFLSAMAGGEFSKVQVGAMTGYRHSSGGFNSALSNLTQAGLIIRNGGMIQLNPDADVTDMVDSTPHTLQDWIRKLGPCERAIYEALLADPERVYSKTEIAERTGYSAGSGGFNNALSRLNTLGLIRRHHGGEIGLNPEVANLGWGA